LQKLKRKEEAKKVLERFKTMSALTERIEYTETAVKINPGNAPLKNELVLLLLQAGRARDAMKHLDELRRTAPSSTVYMNMAKALRMMGARAEADQAEAMAARLLREGH
jgi:predicted Zn-dependent protease